MLLAEIKQQYTEKLREEQENAKGGSRREPKEKKEIMPWHLQCIWLIYLFYGLWCWTDNFGDSQVFQDIADLITFSADKLLNRADKEKIDTFLKHFLQIFFRIEDSIFTSSPMNYIVDLF